MSLLLGLYCSAHASLANTSPGPSCNAKFNRKEAPCDSHVCVDIHTLVDASLIQCSPSMQANVALGFELSSEDMAIIGGLPDQCRQHDSVWPNEPMFKQFFQPLGPWRSRAELWDDNVTYAGLAPGQQ